MSAGHFLTGAGGFAGNPNSPGVAVDSMGCRRRKVIEVAGPSGSDIFGWHEKGDRNERTIIFNGSDGAGTAAPFAPSANFSFSADVGRQPLLHRIQPERHCERRRLRPCLSALRRVQRRSDHLLIGVGEFSVETSLVGNDQEKRVGDFNDMVIRFSEVPEPSTYAMLGGGFLALRLSKFRRRSGSR